MNQTSEEYDKLPKSAKASIAKIRGEKSIFDNADVNTYLLEDRKGYAVYKGKGSDWCGLWFGHRTFVH